MDDTFYPMTTKTFVHEDGSEYEPYLTYDEIVIAVTIGQLLAVNDTIEVWLYDNKVAIVPNDVEMLVQ